MTFFITVLEILTFGESNRTEIHSVYSAMSRKDEQSGCFGILFSAFKLVPNETRDDVTIEAQRVEIQSITVLDIAGKVIEKTIKTGPSV
jgi:hypothetical protein